MPRSVIDITGQRFGRLVAFEYSRDEPHRFMWKCRCDCGAMHFVGGSDLRKGHATSCGCFRRDDSRQKFITHGHSVDGRMTPEYRSWAKAKERCTNPKCVDYQEYGGRGIVMCSAWLDDFSAFLRDM